MLFKQQLLNSVGNLRGLHNAVNRNYGQFLGVRRRRDVAINIGRDGLAEALLQAMHGACIRRALVHFSALQECIFHRASAFCYAKLRIIFLMTKFYA